MGIWGEVASSVLLFCLVFGMSATVEMKSLKKQVRNRMALGIGVVIQFVILPFVGFCVVKILNLPATTGIILLVITSSPGGSYSNWWCSLFNAELALSVTMTTISTLLSVVMLPTNLVLYTRWSYSADVVQSLDWTGLFVSLVVVISGIAGGLYSSYRAEQRGDKANFHRTANRLGNIAGILLVSLSILVSSTGQGNRGDHKASLWNQDAKFYFAVALPPIIGLLLAVKLASHYNLQKPERVAVTIESCYQNTGIATSVALTLYSGDQLSTAIGVPLFYGIVEAILLAIFCVVCWKSGWTKAPADENLCTVLYRTYEADDDPPPPLHPTEPDVESPTVEGVKHDADVFVDLGLMDEEEIGTNRSPGNERKIMASALAHKKDDDVSETEMTSGQLHQQQPSQLQQPAVRVTETTEGSVTMIKVDPGEHDVLGENELPKATRLERAVASVRARAAGYNVGQQDEERGLRTARGPVTLGLSQVPSPTKEEPTSKKKMSKKNKSSDTEDSGKEDNLPAAGKNID